MVCDHMFIFHDLPQILEIVLAGVILMGIVQYSVPAPVTIPGGGNSDPPPAAEPAEEHTEEHAEEHAEQMESDKAGPATNAALD